MTRSLSLLAAFLFLAPADAAPRVVVQDAAAGYPQYYRFSRDGSHLAFVSGVWQHVLVAVDLKGERVLHQLHSADTVASYDFSGDHKRLAFVTNRGLHLLDLDSGAVDLLAGGSYSAVAVDAGGDLVAVLGQPPDAPASNSLGGQYLAVFDLKAKAWKWRAPTPIVVTGPVDVTLAFEGDEVVAAGMGGDPRPMLPVVFACHIRLNTKTGQAVVAHGPAKTRGRPDDKPSLPIKPDPKELEAARVKLVSLEDYEGLKILRDLGGEREKLLGDKAVRATLAKLDASRRASFQHQPLMSRLQGNDLLLALGLPGEIHSRVAILTMSKEGKLSLGPTKDHHRGRLGLKDLHLVRTWDEGYTVHDLLSDKALFTLHIGGKTLKTIHFVEDGALVLSGQSISFTPEGHKEPAWSAAERDTLYGLQTDADENVFAVIGLAGAVIRSKKDGKVLSRIHHGSDTGYLVSQAFSPDGKEHALIVKEHIVVFDAASGKEIAKHPLKGTARYPVLFAHSGGWIVSGYDHTVFFHPKTGWSKPLPISAATFAQEARGTTGRRVILQDSRGRCSLIDPDKPAILTEWIAGYGDAPLYNVVLPGGVVLRSLGISREVDLLRAADGQAIVRIHVLPGDKNQVGYLAYTADGFWDASPGAERYLTIVDDGRLLNEEGRNVRKNPELIGKRIRDGWK